MSDLPAIRQAVRGSAYEDALAERLGINATDLRCLELVLAEPGLTPGRLAEASALTTGAITGVLDRLEQAGFIERHPDPVDRRRMTVSATAGADEVARLVDQLDGTIGRLLGKHTAAERAAIRAFLEAVSGAVAEDTLRLRAGSRGGFVGETYTAPVGGATRGRLVLATGAPRVAVNIAPLGPRASARIIAETSASRVRFIGAVAGGDLIRATFNGPRPDVRAVGGAVTARYRRSVLAAFATRKAEVAFNGAIPWSIEIEGGITDLTGSLAGVILDRLDVAGGVNHVDLELPAPVGTAVVRVQGVASSARFRRPAGVPVALRVAGGVSHLRLDEQRIEQVTGDRRFTSKGFATSEHRYEIEVLDGASDLRISTT